MKTYIWMILAVGTAFVVGRQTVTSSAATGVTSPMQLGTWSDSESDDIVTTLAYVRRCLAHYDAEIDKSSLHAANALTAASRTCSCLYGIEPSQLKPAEADDFRSLTREIDNRSVARNVLLSTAGITAARAAFTGLHGEINLRRNSNWEQLIVCDRAAIDAVQKASASVSDNALLLEIANQIHACQILLNEHQQGQYTSYQRDAMKRCHLFIDYALSNTIISDTTLKTRFDESRIMEIDPMLMNSDLRRLFEYAVGMMDAKLKDRNKAEFHLNLTHPDRKLMKLCEH